MSRSKDVGTRWESAIVDYLHEWAPHVERRALSGVNDRGDIAGIPGVMIEAKATKAITLAQFAAEVARQKATDRAQVGVAWIKRVGKASPGEGYVVMDGAQFVGLLVAAGYVAGEHNG